jgi:hypothetical protein
MTKSRELRFGVRTEGRYSQYWTVRAGATRPDFYLASQRTGRFLHISLHDPSYGMHVKVNAPDGEVRKVLPYPDPFVPGVSRLVQLRVPRAAATSDAPPEKEVEWVDAPDDPEIWVSFEVLVEAPGADLREGEWNRGTTLVGRVPRSGGGSIAVVWWPMRGSGGSLTLPGKPGDRERVQAALAKGTVRACIHGPNPDGSIWFLELSAETAVQASD